MKNINPQTPIWKLTVEEFLEISQKINLESKYEYGLKGLAKILGCSVSKASEIKSSGILDEAIIQNGNIITHYQNVVSLPMSGEEETSNAGEQLVRNNLADWNGLGENIPPDFQEIIPRIYVSQNPSQS